MNCKDCACYHCSQQDNCAMNGCDGGGCYEDNLEYFKADCDDFEQSLYDGEGPSIFDDEDDENDDEDDLEEDLDEELRRHHNMLNYSLSW